MGIEYINQKRKEMKMSYEELAMYSGVPLGTVNKVLSGATKNPTLATVNALCRVLDIHPSELSNNGKSLETKDDEPDEMEAFCKFLNVIGYRVQFLPFKQAEVSISFFGSEEHLDFSVMSLEIFQQLEEKVKNACEFLLHDTFSWCEKIEKISEKESEERSKE